MLRQREEQLVNVVACLRRGLKKVVESFFSHALHAFLIGHLSKVRYFREINPVTHKVDKHVILVSVLFDLIEPRADILEWLPLRHIVHHDRRLTIFVEEFRYWPELFLAGSVPNLQFNDCFPVDLHYESAKFNTNGDLVVVLENSLGQRLHETTLAHSWVSNDDDLKETVWLHFSRWVHCYALSSYLT